MHDMLVAFLFAECVNQDQEQILQESYYGWSTTSNLPFSEWNRVFGDDKLTAALLDRLAQHADVLVTRGPGDRGAHAHKRIEPDEELAPLSP